MNKVKATIKVMMPVINAKKKFQHKQAQTKFEHDLKDFVDDCSELAEMIETWPKWMQHFAIAGALVNSGERICDLIDQADALVEGDKNGDDE